MRNSNSAERLKELMETFGITQKDICEKTGLQKSTVSLYVRGKREPKQDGIYAISTAYGIDPAWLMGFDVSMFKNQTDYVSEVKDIRSKYGTEEEFAFYDLLIEKYNSAEPYIIDMVNKLLQIPDENTK